MYIKDMMDFSKTMELSEILNTVEQSKENLANAKANVALHKNLMIIKTRMNEYLNEEEEKLKLQMREFVLRKNPSKALKKNHQMLTTHCNAQIKNFINDLKHIIQTTVEANDNPNY